MFGFIFNQIASIMNTSRDLFSSDEDAATEHITPDQDVFNRTIVIDEESNDSHDNFVRAVWPNSGGDNDAQIP